MIDWNEIFLKFGINVDTRISGVSVDTRSMRKGDVFIALNSGENYIDQALSSGASCVVTTAEHHSNRVYTVHDTIRFLGEVAAHYRQLLDITVIGVTGSVGKTTCSQTIYQILSYSAPCHVTEGNQNNQIGVPLTILSTPESIKYLIIEMGVSCPKDMDDLVEIAKPDLAVITNIGPSHLEGLKNTRGVWNEKIKIARYAQCLFLPSKCACRETERDIVKMFFGRSEHADIQIVDKSISINNDVYQSPEVQYPHHMESIAISFGVMQFLNLSLADVSKVKLKWPSQRLSITQEPGGPVIIRDYYNANFLSYLVAIDTLGKYCKKQILVFGQMNDLGSSSRYYHRLLGFALNRYGIDMVLVYGYDAHEMLFSYVGEAVFCKTKVELANHLKSYDSEEYVILVKGSRGLQLEEII